MGTELWCSKHKKAFADEDFVITSQEVNCPYCRIKELEEKVSKIRDATLHEVALDLIATIPKGGLTNENG